MFTSNYSTDLSPHFPKFKVSVSLFFLSISFAPPLTAHIWTVGGSYLLGECIYVGRGLFTGESVTVTVSTSSTLP